MTAPVIRQFLGTIPDKGQAQTEFDTNVDAFLDWQALQFAPDLVAFGEFASDTGAALVAANLPSLTGNELDAVRVNAAADGVEFVDVTAAGWTFLAATTPAAQRTALEIPAPVELTQAQAENAASAVFGQVSGQRLAQAVAARDWTYSAIAASASGTAIDFSSLPAGISEIEVVLNGVTTNGSGSLLVQVGPSGTPVATGYVRTRGWIEGAAVSSTAGFPLFRNASGAIVDAVVSLVKSPGVNDWTARHIGTTAGGGAMISGFGIISLAGDLDILRVTRITSGNFTAGNIWIRYR